jgi:hypothetical protein
VGNCVTERHSADSAKEEVVPRPLLHEERDLLSFLLQAGFPGVQALRSQIEHTTVVSRCGCGCPSVSLLVDKDKTEPTISYDDIIPVEGLPAEEPTGPAVLLFVRDGYLDDLELMYLSDTPPPDWPALSELMVHVR